MATNYRILYALATKGKYLNPVENLAGSTKIIM
jgi:hypothetical protein